MIFEVGLESGHVVEKTRAQMMASTLIKSGWTIAEVEYARHAVVSVPELVKEISYERTIGPGLFAAARLRSEVARGRLFTHPEAVAWCNGQKGDRELLGDLFEVVRIEGDDNPKWMLK